jgi:hypothetical protein
MTNSDCLEEDFPECDFTTGLDIKYTAFEYEIQYAKRYHQQLRRHEELTKSKEIEPVNTHTVLDRSKHRICEDWELEYKSKWRGNFLKEEKRESLEKDRKKRYEESQTSLEKRRKKCHEESQTSWEKDREKRYKMWLNDHRRAIYALEGYIRRNSFSDDKDVCGLLRDLWCFLPQEFSPCGTDIKLQRRHILWITRQTTILRRVEINKFLHSLVENFCKQDKGALASRIGLYKGDSESNRYENNLLKEDMLASGAYAFLVERLLLQTPLLFWPAVFKPGVSRYFEENTKPSEVFYPSIHELAVQCSNTRWSGGYEVSILWARSLQYEKSEHISRCSRAHEYRFELNISPFWDRANWDKSGLPF